MNSELKYVKVRDVKNPERGTSKSAGLDLFVPSDLKTLPNTSKGAFLTLSVNKDNKQELALRVNPHCHVLIPSGLHFKVPENHALIAFNKSGVAAKLGLAVGACVIDEDYTGEVHISLFNTTDNPVDIFANQKIVQLLLLKVDYCNAIQMSDLNSLYHNVESERGSGGFGSTGH